MKSPMVERVGYIKDKSNYTELQVLRSAAGYYIGALYNNYKADGSLMFQEPGSRDSDYYATEAEAAADLKLLQEDSEAAPELRTHP